MAIDFPGTLPAPSSINFQLYKNVQSFASTFTHAQQTVELLGGHWLFTATWEIISREQLPTFRAFLANLRGGAEQFYFSDVSHTSPAGDAAGNITVLSNTVRSLEVQAEQADTLIFKAGDYIEVITIAGVNEYKIVSYDVTTDATGIANIPIEPAFRHEPSLGAPVLFDNPRGLFMSTNNIAGWNVSSLSNGESLTISAKEWMV